MDLSTVEGLTPEQVEAIGVLNSQEIQGLKAKNEQLLTEKKTVQQSASEKEIALEEARQTAVKAEEAKLLAEGKYEEAQKLREEERAKLIAESEAKAKTAQENLEKYHKGQALNDALSLVHEDYRDLSNALLSNMIKIAYNENGEAVTTFEHKGEVVAKNVAEFKSWASEQDAFKKVLNGVDSSGAGSKGSSSGASAPTNKAYGDMTPEEKRAYLKNVKPNRN